MKFLLLYLLAFRLLNAAVLKTAFAPDEHYQGPEVAHWVVFGYGFLTWEWEHCIALRGTAHPLLFAVAFWILKTLNLANAVNIAVAPRVVQSIFAALGDWSVFHLTKNWYGPRVANVALLLTVTSWFNFMTMCRPYSNTIESCLIVFMVYLWSESSSPSRKSVVVAAADVCDASNASNRSAAAVTSAVAHEGVGVNSWKLRTASLVVAASCWLLRPTSALFFAPFCGMQCIRLLPTALTQVCRYPHQKQSDAHPDASRRYKACVDIVGTALIAMAAGVAALALGLAIDRKFYGAVVFPPANLLRFNSLTGANDMFGKRNWNFYLFEGPVVTLLTFYPFLLSHLAARGKRLIVSAHNTSSASPASSVTADNDSDGRRVSPPVTAALDVATVKTWSRESLDVAIGVSVTLLVLSGSAHKEHRLLLPVHLLMLVYCSEPFARFFEALAAGTPTAVWGSLRRSKKLLALGVIIPQLVAAYVTTQLHLQGSDRVVDILRATALPDAPPTHRYLSTYFPATPQQQPTSSTATPQQQPTVAEARCPPSVFFLTACHHLPMYSRLHAPIPMGFFDCSPDLSPLYGRPTPGSWRKRFWDNPTPTLELLFGDVSLPGNWSSATTPSHDTAPLEAVNDVFIHPLPGWKFTRQAAWFGGLTPSSSSDQSNTSASSSYEDGVIDCLNYRTLQPLRASQLPSYFVVASQVLPRVHPWLSAKGFRELPSVSPVFDSWLAESFDGVERNSYIHVFEHLCRSN